MMVVSRFPSSLVWEAASAVYSCFICFFTSNRRMAVTFVSFIFEFCIWLMICCDLQSYLSIVPFPVLGFCRQSVAYSMFFQFFVCSYCLDFSPMRLSILFWLSLRRSFFKVGSVSFLFRSKSLWRRLYLLTVFLELVLFSFVPFLIVMLCNSGANATI